MKGKCKWEFGVGSVAPEPWCQPGYGGLRSNSGSTLRLMSDPQPNPDPSRTRPISGTQQWLLNSIMVMFLLHGRCGFCKYSESHYFGRGVMEDTGGIGAVTMMALSSSVLK